jgi:hypothetical protein
VDVDMTDLRQVARDVERLREDVDYLTVLLEPGPPSGPPAPGVVPLPSSATAVPPQRPTAARVWHSLTGAEAADAWTALTTWVDWLTARYQLDDTLPACWYGHGAIVDELDALRAAWTGAYLNPNAAADAAANWLELFARTVARVRDWDRYGCAAGTHHPDAPPSRDPAARERRDDYLHSEIEARSRLAEPDATSPEER